MICFLQIIFCTLLVCFSLSSELQSKIKNCNHDTIERYLKSRFPVVQEENNAVSFSAFNQHQMQQMIIDYLASFYKDEGILDANAIRDLDIIQEEGEDLLASLVNILQPRTKTGEATLLLLLLHPTKHMHIIKQRQDLVCFFVENPELMANIDSLLQNIGYTEHQFLSLIGHDFISKETETKYWPKISIYESYIRRIPSLFMAHHLGMFGIRASISIALKMLPLFLYAMTQETSYAALSGIISWGISYFVDCSLYVSLIDFLSKSQKIQHQFVGVLSYLNAVNLLLQLFETIRFFQTQPLFLQLHETVISGKSLNDVRHFLTRKTFVQQRPILHHWGNVFVAYQKIKNIDYDIIANLLHVIGELDVAISLAKIIFKEKTNKHECWCFAQFEKNMLEPKLLLKSTWNPLLLQHKSIDEVISNDISFHKGLKNIVLTGPNSCGKTSITTGFVIAILLAQSVGVVPAIQCTLTPFDHIYILCAAKSANPKGKSRFHVELNQIKQFLTDLELVWNKGGFTFAVLDEIFTGTNPSDGESAAREFLKYFLQKNVNNNGLMIISTHYQSLTEIAKQNIVCANYKVDVQRDTNGSFKKLFRFLPGVSLVRNALDMFKNDFLL